MCVVDCNETTIGKYAGSRDEQGEKSKEKEDIKPMVMRNIRQTFLCHPFPSAAPKRKEGPNLPRTLLNPLARTRRAHSTPQS